MSRDLRPSVMLVSIDALKPEFVFEQERLGVNLPNIRYYFVENGLTARAGMKSVFPPYTYPCHHSMITGTHPAVHGVGNNGIFDPCEKHMEAWNWCVSKKVKNLWEAAKENGYCSASAAFPVSVGAKGDFIAPEFWWDGSELDSTFIDMVAHPQYLISEMEQDIGRYASGMDLSDEGDAQRGKAAVWILKNKIAPLAGEKPFFLSAYFSSFDESAHEHGVYSPEAARSLEKIDRSLGELIAAAREIAGEKLVVCVVSDHGTIDNTHTIFPNVLFKRAGLIETDASGRVTAWKVFMQRAGGTAEIHLADREDAETRAKVEEILEGLRRDPESGVLEVLTGEESKARGGFPDADYVLVSQKGYELREQTDGEYCSTKLFLKAQHGYSEEFEEMRASFMLAGWGIEKGNIEQVNLIDVAPTLAGIMGFTLKDAQGRNLLKK